MPSKLGSRVYVASSRRWVIWRPRSRRTWPTLRWPRWRWTRP